MTNASSSAPAQTFNFNAIEVRVLDCNGSPWFIAADVTAALGYPSAKDAVARLDDDEKGAALTRTLGGYQRMVTINESGLYALVLRSRKPEARKFAKWVTSEVLPAIRKTGSYSAAPAAPTEKLPSLQFRRFLVWYDDNGAEQIKSVPMDACIISPSNPDKLAEFLLEMVPQHLIGEAIATLTGRTLRLLNDHQRQSTAAAAVKKLGGKA